MASSAVGVASSAVGVASSAVSEVASSAVADVASSAVARVASSVHDVGPGWAGRADDAAFTGPVALLQTGSGSLIDRTGCPCGTSDPVGYVGSGWTGDTDCDDLGGIVFVLPCAGSGEPIVCVSNGWTERKVTIKDRLVVLSVLPEHMANLAYICLTARPVTVHHKGD